MQRSPAARFRSLALLGPIALAGLAAPVRAQPAAIEIRVSGVTANTEVTGGDACGTGLTGPNACNGQVIEIVWSIFETLAPADGDPSATTHGIYSAGGDLFLAATATINGRTFDSLSGTSPPANQLVQIWDEINTTGVTDRVLIGLDGTIAANSDYLASNLLLGQALAGDDLGQLAGPFTGAPIFGGASLFGLSNGDGRVIGQYGVTAVTFGVPEPALAAQASAAVLALAATRRARSRR